MTDNDQLLHKIGNLIDQKLKPINKRLDAQSSSIAQINTTLGQVKTLVEATAAGQKELQETVATKADVLTISVKVDKLRK